MEISEKNSTAIHARIRGEIFRKAPEKISGDISGRFSEGIPDRIQKVIF